MVPQSILFTLGDKPELQRKATTTGADVVVFDLVVAPDQRDTARNAINQVVTDDEFNPACKSEL